MQELRLPDPSNTVSLQLLLTRALDSLTAYLHAARISRSSKLRSFCTGISEVRRRQVDEIAAMMEERGEDPDFGSSREADFQLIWMSLVERRSPSEGEDLPRECERGDRRFERVLMRLWEQAPAQSDERITLGDYLHEVREAVEMLHQLQEAPATPRSSRTAS